MTKQPNISVGDFVTYTKAEQFYGRVLAIVTRKNGTVRYVVEREIGTTIKLFTRRALTPGRPVWAEKAEAELARIKSERKAEMQAFKSDYVRKG